MEMILSAGTIDPTEDIMVAITEEIMEDTRTTTEPDTAAKESKPFLIIVAELIPIITTIVRVDMVHNNSRRIMEKNKYFLFGEFVGCVNLLN